MDGEITREFIRQRAEEIGASLRAISLKLGRSSTYLSDYIGKGSPRRLHADDLEVIAAELHVTTEDLKAGRILPAVLNSPKSTSKMVPSNGWVARDVPILGGVRGGQEGVFVNDGTVFGWADRPPSLVGVQDAYFLPVYGDSMFPMYKNGEGVWVNPNIPLMPGKGVVIQLAGEHEGDAHQYFIKEFRRRTAKDLVCHQYNPDGEVRYPLARVVRADAVDSKKER